MNIFTFIYHRILDLKTGYHSMFDAPKGEQKNIF